MFILPGGSAWDFGQNMGYRPLDLGSYNSYQSQVTRYNTSIQMLT